MATQNPLSDLTVKQAAALLADKAVSREKRSFDFGSFAKNNPFAVGGLGGAAVGGLGGYLSQKLKPSTGDEEDDNSPWHSAATGAIAGGLAGLGGAAAYKGLNQISTPNPLEAALAHVAAIAKKIPDPGIGYDVKKRVMQGLTDKRTLATAVPMMAWDAQRALTSRLGQQAKGIWDNRFTMGALQKAFPKMNFGELNNTGLRDAVFNAVRHGHVPDALMSGVKSIPGAEQLINTARTKGWATVRDPLNLLKDSPYKGLYDQLTKSGPSFNSNNTEAIRRHFQTIAETGNVPELALKGPIRERIKTIEDELLRQRQSGTLTREGLTSAVDAALKSPGGENIRGNMFGFRIKAEPGTNWKNFLNPRRYSAGVNEVSQELPMLERLFGRRLSNVLHAGKYTIPAAIGTYAAMAGDPANQAGSVSNDAQQGIAELNKLMADPEQRNLIMNNMNVFGGRQDLIDRVNEQAKQYATGH